MPEETPAPAVETKPALKSTTMWGGYLATASAVVLAVGPGLLKHVLGCDDQAAFEATQAIATLLTVISGQMVSTGRSKAGIKPLH